ncbi:MAG: autotransporter outer membrane beta-barrel domain-containing protein [Pseudomonadota bacterium]|nr:autotransporter outer membrane beta-barrel domain-containing protein [Pseudomonadota bacterium]
MHSNSPIHLGIALAVAALLLASPETGVASGRVSAVATHVNATNAMRTDDAILSHLTRIAAPGASDREIGPRDAVARPAAFHGSGDILSPVTPYARLRPERLNRNQETIGHKTQRGALKTILPYLASDSALRTGLFSSRRHYEYRDQDGTVKRAPQISPKLAKRARLSLWLDGSSTPVAPPNGSGFDGDTIALSAGGDAWLNATTLAGISMTYSDTYVTMNNPGGIHDETAFGVAPYLLFRPNAWLDLSASAGVARFDIRRIAPIGTQDGIDRSDAFSAYVALNAAASTGICTIDGLRLSGSTGFIRSVRYEDSFSSGIGGPDSDFARLTGDGEIAYRFTLSDGIGLEPYLIGDLQADLLDRIENDGFFGEFGGGLRFVDEDADLRASLEGYSILGFQETPDQRLRGTLAMDIDTDLFGGGAVSPGLTVLTTQDTFRTDLGVHYRNDDQAVSMGLTTYLSGDYALSHGSVAHWAERDKGVRLSGHLSF